MVIRINRTGDGCWDLYDQHQEWKNWVMADFNKYVVVMGNREYESTTEADWWNEAYDLIEDIDNSITTDGLEKEFYNFYNEKGITKESLDKVKEIYTKCKTYEDVDVIADVVMALHPEMKIKTATIRGYVQREWQEIAYVNGCVDDENKLISNIESLYFGKISEVTIEHDDYNEGDILTDDELWNMERKGLKSELRKRYEIDENEELKVYQCDGYIKALNWKEVV